MSRVLVIRLGALGDFVLSFAPFAAIRAHHAQDQVTLLTTTPFAGLARASPWFDHVALDVRPAWWQPGLVWRLRRLLRSFDLVYDLQTSRRSAIYYRLAGSPPWSGVARGCSLPHRNPQRDAMHTLERQGEQLADAGVEPVTPDLAWLAAAASPPMPQPFALLVPGAAPHRPEKRWPAAHYGALATMLQARGIVPVVVGTASEAWLAGGIRAVCPAAIDLTGQTTLFGLAALAARAELAIGNDTGPMHLAAAMGAPSVVLFSGSSDPVLTAPRGPGGTWPVVLRAPDLADLTVDRVAAALPLPS